MREQEPSELPSATCCFQFYPNYPTLNDSLGGKPAQLFLDKNHLLLISNKTFSHIHPSAYLKPNAKFISVKFG